MAYHRCGSVAAMPPETVCEVVIGPRTIALACDEDGEFHAVDNMCVHLGGPLGRGYVDGDRLVCPLHGWEYELSDGSCVMMPGYCLPRFPVRVEGDDIFVDVPWVGDVPELVSIEHEVPRHD
jgi:nitrite reductase/ring-hydroxylating ferredoxin subunit